ncbi:hypothetical protein BKA64DRAFT_567549 [Cadophora sp. MPI-SDFR-AT-0126]|nr:hypothetical protein BKA64DRAFT_567549 [Leotiomycetes sp. MPI-SDFR-AT-0126]
MSQIEMQADFRNYIPSRDTQRSKDLAACDAYQWAEIRGAEPFMIGWKAGWESLFNEPYKGITTDGNVIADLYQLASETVAPGGGNPTANMTKAAKRLLDIASPRATQSLWNSRVDAPEWRRWINPEIYICRHGIRLEETSEDVVEAIHDLMRASLSPEGYAKARGCMKVNQFLGEVVDGRKVLNEKSYNFSIFGTPSVDEPWGWQIFGHHFAMNCFVVRTQIVISPVFMGAEPNVIDSGPEKGTELFTDQERLAIKLMQSMNKATVEHVRIFQQLSGPEYPEGRYHRADQRHLGGAFQDNRVVPYEGAKVSTFSQDQQALVRQLLILSLNYLPEEAFQQRMMEILTNWGDTYFAWIGGFGKEDAFYYKIHSPVVMAEFDHHTGVFLDNKVPLPFHIHTLVRTPNGNDYGDALLKHFLAAKGAVETK